ncbi:MAG: glycosyltransferase family 9 protein [Ignavibacteriaceae bacterium]|nr:glycosyltransferase family 9 protein [Ignavibacteriaceae bacterium]
MLCSLPLYQALKKKYPESSITLVASPTNYPIPFQKINPFIAEVIFYDKTSFNSIYQFYKKLWHKKYYLGIVPSTVKISTTSHIINYLSRAKLRVGVKSIDGIKNPAARLLNIKKDFYWSQNNVHQTQRNIEIAQLAGCGGSDINYKFRLNLSREDQNIANNFMYQNFPDNKRIIIGFHPGAGKITHIWDTNNFIKLIEDLYKKYNNYIFITSGEIDKGITNKIIDVLLRKEIKFSLAENMPVLQLAAVLGHINLYITNDTGPMHIAGMTSVNQISLMLPTNEFEWAPKGNYKYSLKSEPGDINTIKYEDVLELCNKILAG